MQTYRSERYLPGGQRIAPETVADELAEPDDEDVLVDVAEGVVVGLGDRVGKILGGSEDVVDGEDDTVIVATVEADAVIVGEAVAEFELEVVAEDEAVADEVTVAVSLAVTVTELERETTAEDDDDREVSGLFEEVTVADVVGVGELHTVSDVRVHVVDMMPLPGNEPQDEQEMHDVCPVTD